MIPVAQLFLAVTHYVTVAGLGGEPDYEQRFKAQAGEIEKLVAGPDARLITLSGAEATRTRMLEALSQLARQAAAEDTLVLMLIGHGTFDGVDYKLNLAGPDLTAADLAAALDRIPARQLIVNMTSASGGGLGVIRKANRVVIAATKSGMEKNATVFPRYWVEALRDPAADTDKNESVSALEAFRYADQKTAAYYESQKRLATEHAVLDDTGEGEAVRNPSPENGKGQLAARFTLLRLGAAQKAAADPAKQALIRKKEGIEISIDKLKYQKAAMPAAQYRKALEALLLELARVQEELDQ
jgi:hypothetical protein